MKKIEKLTPEQEALLPAFVDYGLQYGLNTSPCDRPKAEAAIRAHYAALNRPEPKLIIWLDSPHQGAIGAAMLAGTKFSGAQVRAQVWAQVWDQVRDQVWDQVRAQVRDQVWHACYGQHDASWLAFYEFFERECGLECCEKLRGMQTAAQHCDWWWPFANAVIITERPRTLVHDAEGRLHREDGPALQYPDGWGIWAWHGVRVPQDVIERPETITVEQIEHERNAEARRVLITRYGQDRYLRDSGAQQLHRDDWGALWRKELAGDEPLVMVQVTNSTAEPDGTYKDYFLRVQPELRPLRDDGLGEPQELTALNAVASTFGMTGREYCRELAAQS